MPFYKRYTGPDLCEIRSGMTTGVVAGHNRVVGLHGHTLTGS